MTPPRTSTTPPSGTGRSDATRLVILTAAERLFAERGFAAVANRDIVEAAGQSNNSAVAYHFGSRDELVRAISARHTGPIARRTAERCAGVTPEASTRDLVACLVMPYLEHLDALGEPSWYARFNAQVVADPAYSAAVRGDSVADTGVQDVYRRLWNAAPPLPPEVRELREQAMRAVVVTLCAQRERAATEHGTSEDWIGVGSALVDALVGLAMTPVGPRATGEAGQVSAQ